ncbi:MAG: hypothetical protein QM692_04225 [Thermomicrobiales bacterium]
MRDRFHPSHLLTARIIVWAALSAIFLWYLRWGSETVSITSYYHIRRSVPYIWNAFHDGLPDAGNQTLLDIVYWGAIAASVLGVIALLWLALIPSEKESAKPETEQRPS